MSDNETRTEDTAFAGHDPEVVARGWAVVSKHFANRFGKPIADMPVVDQLAIRIVFDHCWHHAYERGRSDANRDHARKEIARLTALESVNGPACGHSACVIGERCYYRAPEAG